VQLPVGAITESILVTGEEEKVLEVSRTELSQGILPVQIRQLPVRGRNFVDLTLLTPRVIQSDRSSQGSAQQTFGTQHLQLSFSGLRNQYNLMLMDGADATWHIAQVVKSFYSLEAVREFRVIGNLAPAEYGRLMGGAVVVATQTGTNEFHGVGFYYLRHSGLDARDILTRRHHFRLGQFGGGIGGPIIRDRIFLFGNYEGSRQRKALQLPQQFLENVGRVNERLRQLGLPEENPGELYKRDADAGLIRADVNWGKHQLFLRYNIFDDREENYLAGEIGALGLPLSPNGGAEYELRDQAVVAGVTSVIGARWINEGLFQFSTTRLRSDVPRLPDFTLVVLGFAEMGNTLAYSQLPHERRWQVRDYVGYTRGGHQFKFGIDVNHLQTSVRLGNTRRLVIFPNLASFLALTPAQVQLYSEGRGTIGTEWHLVGLFGQTQWQATPRLTLSLGLRYDVEVVGGEAPVIVETDKNNVQPRVGMAYSLTSKTVLRTGFGVFHGNYFESYVAAVDIFGRVNFPNFSDAYVRANPFARKYRPRPDYNYWVVVSGPAARELFLDFVRTKRVPPPAGAASLVINRPDPPNPYALQWGVEIQRELWGGVSMEIGYAGVRGLKMPVAINTNLMPAAATLPSGKNDYQFPARRWDPNFSTIYVLSPLGSSIYHGLTLSVRRQWARGIGMVVNYAFSKTIDNNQGPGTFTAPEDPYRLDLDRAVSADDLPHRVVANVWMEAPASWPFLFRDFQVSTIVTAEIGRVHNVTVGRDVNRDGQAFTDRPGALGRNTYRGPKFVSVDLRVGRKVPLGERIRMEAGVDVFNLFNRVNILNVNTTWGSEDLGRPSQPAFGNPQRVANARQIRLGLRLAW
jgi:hypothetical protein